MTNRIAEMDPSLRPRERLLCNGASVLNDAELIAVLLRTGRRGRGAIADATELLNEVGGLPGLARLDVREMLARPGCGPAKASVLAASLELGRRLALCEWQRSPALGNPKAAASYLIRRFAGENREIFGFVSLDCRHRPLRCNELYRGTKNQAPVDTAEVFRSAVLDDASAVLVFHNHPSRDPTPSRDDIEVTRRLAAAGTIVGITVVDHLIVGGRTCISLRTTNPEAFTGR